MKIQNMDFWNQLALRPQIALWRRPTARRRRRLCLTSRSDVSPPGQADGKRPSWGSRAPSSRSISSDLIELFQNWFCLKVGVFKKK